ncbi:hypothetical protein GOP47_0028555 [Adiantum capillus-veneris]|nr:hypothetical protein GOP47_0028555 [Adiantum capillus-veneris]
MAGLPRTGDSERVWPSCEQGVVLFGLAMEQIVRCTDVDGVTTVRVLEGVSQSLGSRGMVGGQIVDLERITMDHATESARHEGLDVLTYIHTHKTTILLECSVVAGAILGGACVADAQVLCSYAWAIGLLFQVVDDILDVT